MSSENQDILILVEDVRAKAEVFSISQDAKNRKYLYEAATKLAYATETPLDTFSRIRFAPHQYAACRVSIEAGWLDLLVDGKTKTATELAQATDAERSLIVRIMRILTASKIVAEPDVETYGATPFVSLLHQLPGTLSGMKMIFDECMSVLSKLPEYFANNGFKLSEDPWYGPYAFTHGKTFWKLFEEQPLRRQVFDSSMTVRNAVRVHFLDLFPLSKLLNQPLRDDREIFLVDIGGGQGQDLRELAARERNLPGKLVLQEQPNTIAEIDPAWKDDFELMEYDFFKPQPIHGARAYYFHSVFHDWPDSYCRRILRNTATAMAKGYSSILIHEMVLPDKGASLTQACVDLTMLVTLTGRERTAEEWAKLLDLEGLCVKSMWTPENSTEGVIEAVLKG